MRDNPEALSLLIESMTNLCLFPHKAELDAFLFNRNPLPDLELRLLGAGQRSVQKFLEALPTESLPSRIFLVGCAGALNPKLQIGDVVIQSVNERTLYLSSTPILSKEEAQRLFEQTQKQAVVMESFWSDVTPPNELRAEFIEIRAISDHCDRPQLSEIRERLPTLMKQCYLEVIRNIRAAKNPSPF